MSTGQSPLVPPPLREQLRTLRAGGASFNTIAAVLNKGGLRGNQGGRWFAASVRRVLLQGSATPPSHLTK